MARAELVELTKRCFWQKRNPEDYGSHCKRSFVFRDKCGKPWGFSWIFKYEDESDYRVVCFVHGSRTTFKKYPTAYQSIRALQPEGILRA
tara:strand:- start:3528 stop:3797 length:270 start_codon:yes stop_codon:yes gene_type:complete